MRLAMIAVPLASVALLAGCGSSAPKSNGEAAKTGAQIVADAKAAAGTASSVHVAGSAGTGLTLDLRLVAGKGGQGTMTTDGVTFEIVRIGKYAYFKGDATFWRSFGGAAAATLLKGRWLRASATSGQLAALTPLTDVSGLFEAIFSGQGKLEVGKTATIGDTPAIAVTDTSDGSVLYVATTGKPYLLKIEKKGSGAVTFDEWDTPVALKAPADPVDISKLTP